MKALFILKAIEGAPSEFQVLPYGEIVIEGEKPAHLDDESIASIIADFERRGNDMVIDYEHQTLDGVQAPAAGWVKSLINKGKEGLWAVVEWTEKAKQYLTDKEYRYFSPVFWMQKQGRRIIKIENIALTNYPRVNNLRPIVAKMTQAQDEYIAKNKDKGGDIMWEKLKKLLGLADDAGEDAAYEAVELVVNKNKDLEKAAGNKVEVVACKEVLGALKLEEGADKERVIASISALQAPATAAQELSQEVARLNTKLSEMEQNDLVGLALKEGKTSPDELDKWGRDLALKSPEQFKLIVLSRPAGSVVPLETILTIRDKIAGAIDDATLQVAKMMGNTEEDLQKYAQA